MLKTKTIKIETGRDAGKTFVITEMPIAKIDNWSMRAMLGLLSAGVDINGLNPNDGVLAMARLAFETLGRMPEDKAVELMNELLDCVQIKPEGGSPRPLALELNDVADFKTLWALRKEAFMLHIDFLQQGVGQTLA